ncbi:tRNA (adenosine(37)-N6)-threonylcarbamoyltransferase complex transferase subunit TsaD [Yunchengibacter salinarum]|uniref:tRNA (adenosine(37)-N6)-threonylcarbamoyltransferase complex transferase subunit TsaD n=1 Tax=Yunchengibacter salinarum TaxID=3133399 RepID=UPI0035B6651F
MPTTARPAITEPLILGIETSCDETAVALVDGAGRIHGHEVLSQLDAHRDFGGVVPEIAARQHISHLDHLIARVLDEAGITTNALTAIAATTGPGLIGGLMVGVMTAKAMARAAGKPFLAINHLEGHALTARLTEDVPFPYLLLLVSGGHCQILDVADVGRYRRLGSTVDDAAGEAFDKTAKLLGLGHPGGPAVERAARQGDPNRFALPRPMTGKPHCNFSFSGLKTAVRRAAETCVAERGALYSDDRADLCAAFQQALGACLEDRLNRAAALFLAAHGTPPPGGHRFVLAGGVAANAALRARLETAMAAHGFRFHAPPMDLCTDNGAMIAWAGVERWRAFGPLDESHVLPRARWPLDSEAAPVVGSGRKGAKA